MILPSYQAIAWLCWVPNLVVVEWLVLTRPASALQQSAPDAPRQTGVV